MAKRLGQRCGGQGGYKPPWAGQEAGPRVKKFLVQARNFKTFLKFLGASKGLWCRVLGASKEPMIFRLCLVEVHN